MLKQGKLCRKRINIACYGMILGNYLYMYAMLYAKMFHGYDKMKHFETWYKRGLDSYFSNRSLTTTTFWKMPL